MGQETRLDLLRVLLGAGPSGQAAGDVAARLGVPPSTLSFHLRALDQAGLIAPTRQGRSLIYAAQVDRLRALLTFASSTRFIELDAVTWSNNTVRVMTRNISPATFDLGSATLAVQATKRRLS